MEAPEVSIARYAASVSLVSLYLSIAALAVSAGLFAIELRRRLDEGVRLSVTLIAEAMTIGGAVKDSNTYVSVTVTNRGSAPTTLTHIVLYDYPHIAARWIPLMIARRIKSTLPRTYLAPTPSQIQPLPFLLEPGRNWMGLIKHDERLTRMLDADRLYLGIVGSHSDGTLLRRIRRRILPKLE